MFGQIAEPSGADHPYYPLGVEIPHYAANTTPVLALLPALAGMLGSVLLATGTLALRFNPGLSRGEMAVFCWFVLCKFVSSSWRESLVMIYVGPWGVYSMLITT